MTDYLTVAEVLAMHADQKRVYSVNYLRNQPVGGFRIVRCDEVPNLVKVTTDFRVEVIGDHSPDCVRRAAALFSRK